MTASPDRREEGAAFLIVDLQNDFCPGGALAVPEGDQVVPIINRVAALAADAGWMVYASRDWHPPDSRHFARRGGRWPVHCVARSTGADFHPDLRLPAGTRLVVKGESPDQDGYSAFEGRTETGAPLLADLRRHGITRLVVGGLATDYCVRQSVLDALEAGLEVTLLRDAVRGVEATPGDAARALSEMQEAGARLAASDDLAQELTLRGLTETVRPARSRRRSGAHRLLR